MRVSHTISTAFDDPNLIGTAGLVPVMGLAQKAGLYDLVTEQMRVPGSAGANAAVKIASLVAGMVAGADSIEDMDLVRHGELDAVASRVLVNLTGLVPDLIAGAEAVAYLDIDDTIRATHGYAKQGSGYTGVKGSTSSWRRCPPRSPHRCWRAPGCARATSPPATAHPG